MAVALAGLTPHQIKRIRRATAAEVERIALQERYWTGPALRAVLDRVEDLIQETPEAAEEAGRHALRLAERCADAGPDLRARAFALHGSALRYLGRFDAAMDQYSTALGLSDLSALTRSTVRQRWAVAAACVGDHGQAHRLLDEALEEDPESSTARAIRGWLLMLAGDLRAALRECMQVFERADPEKDMESILSTAVNAANVLSHELLGEVGEEERARIETAISICRASLPSSGRAFYRAQRSRHILARAEALMLARAGAIERAEAMLRRCVEGLSESFADDALFAAADLMVIRARMGDGPGASMAASVAREMIQRAKLKPHPRADKAFTMALELSKITEAQAIELRTWLRVT